MSTPADTCIDKLADLAFGEAIKTWKYVRHYKKNLQKLLVSFRDLGDRIQIVTTEVLAAEARGDEIQANVPHWQTDANILKDAIEKLISIEASIQCIACSCPNISQRYKFSKHAEEKIANADVLIRNYSDLKDCISHPGSHYKENLQKLQVRLRDLGDCMDRIKGKVSEAKDRGHEIEVNVSHWQTDADSLKDGIEQLIRESTEKANKCSTECQSPDIKWQYEFCKHAEDNIAGADELIVKCNNFKDPISHPKAHSPKSLSDTNYVNFDSRASIFKDIMDALRKSDVNMIGVFGPGGVGKTTLVKEVGEQMRKDRIFNQVAIATVSANLNVKEVQTRLAASLNFKFEAAGEDDEGRAAQLQSKFLNEDSYLVILDDIWEEVKMEAIGIPCRNGEKGCKVLLTSRNEKLLSTVMEVDRNFHMKILSSAEAWTLFAKTLSTTNAGNSNQSQQKMNSLAYKVCDPPKENSLEYKVCERCQGLPVAIVALSKALKGEQEHAWTTALDKMEKYMLIEVEGINPSGLASLKVSYDMLHTADAKSCFLLCCFFAEDAEIQLDELTRICMARSLLAQNPSTLEKARHVVRTVLDVLKSASLLSNGNDEDAVRIHDVIRGAGIQVARDQNESFLIDHGVFRWPQNPNGPSYSAISLIFKNINELPDGLVYPKLHTLMIENSELSDVQFPNDFFAGMTQLTVLSITRMRMQQLPSSLAKLTKLRMLYLNECELADISMLKDLKKNLEVLSLQGSYIQALPVEIGDLTNLRVFDLQGCYNLTVIPRGVISKLKSLEELYFAVLFGKWGGTIAEQGDTRSRDNVSLEELKWLLKYGQLTTLFIHIPDVMLLPKEDLIFAKVKRFAISVGLPFHLRGDRLIPGRTRWLKLEESQLRNDFITLAEKADWLIFHGIKGLNKVFRNGTVGKKFLDLKYLEIVSCDDDWEYFLGEPKSSEQSRGLHDLQPFNKLTWLIIEEFESKYLFSPTATRGLVHLEKLEVRSCKIMEGIVGFEGQNDANEIIGEVKFGELKKLVLESLPNLISFYVKKEKTGTTVGSSSADAQPLFNEKVASPTLEQLIEIQEKEGINNNIIVFPQLKSVLLEGLPKLKSFYAETEGFFSYKDAFPVLDKIELQKSGTAKVIYIEDESSEKINLQIIEFFRSGKEFQSVEGDSTAGKVSHTGVGCDGCYVCPIIGPVFKSIVKPNYELCSVCFLVMGVAIDYVRRDHPFASFKRLCDPELDDGLEIPNEISMKQATKVWELFLKIFRYGKQFKEEYGTSGKVSDTSDEELDQDLKIFVDKISMKQANALWKIYFMIFENGKQSKEECGTSGKEIDPNGEELNEDLDISTNKISMEDALTMLQKIFFKNIQNMMESKGKCGTSSKGNGKESNHNGEELDEDLETLNKISMEDAITVPGKIFENIRNGEESKEECGTGSKENDHNGEELNDDLLETPTNEISMEDALTVLGKIFENIYGKESKEKCGASGKESDQSCEES